MGVYEKRARRSRPRGPIVYLHGWRRIGRTGPGDICKEGASGQIIKTSSSGGIARRIQPTPRRGPEQLSPGQPPSEPVRPSIEGAMKTSAGEQSDRLPWRAAWPPWQASKNPSLSRGWAGGGRSISREVFTCFRRGRRGTEHPAQLAIEPAPSSLRTHALCNRAAGSSFPCPASHARFSRPQVDFGARQRYHHTRNPIRQCQTLALWALSLLRCHSLLNAV